MYLTPNYIWRKAQKGAVRRATDILYGCTKIPTKAIGSPGQPLELRDMQKD